MTRHDLKRYAAFGLCFLLPLLALYHLDAQTAPLPMPVLEEIPQALIFDKRVSGGAQLNDIYFVWGATHLRNTSTMLVSYYYPNQRDLDRLHTLEWFKKNHPDWVTYQCDGKTPSYGYIYDWGAYTPIDTSNPEVRRYLLDTYFLPAIQNGYRVLALDNVSIDNADKRCGVWRNGQWVQQFSGEFRDPAFVREKLDYLRWLAKEMHSRGVAIALNAKVDPAQPQETSALIGLADIWLDEGGFGDSCRRRVVDGLWLLKRQLIQQNANKAYVSVNKVCGDTIAQLTPEEASFIVASFLVNRNSHSYLSVFGLKESGVRVDSPLLHPDLGHPLAEAQTQGALLWRSYEHGLVAVNPSSKASAVFAPPPGRWLLNGQPITSGAIEMAPRSGVILYK